MKDVTTTHRIRALACAASLLPAIACAPAAPPPHVVEVPIDQFQAGPAPATPDAAGATAEVVAEPTAPSSPTGAGPAPLPTPPPAAAAPTTPALPSSERLTSADCGRLMDRAAVLFGVDKGMSFAKASKSVTTLRKQSQSDPNVAQVRSLCSDHVSKGQYQCGVKATSLDSWKACVE